MTNRITQLFSAKGKPAFLPLFHCALFVPSQSGCSPRNGWKGKGGFAPRAIRRRPDRLFFGAKK